MMASWIDVFSLVATALLFVGSVAGILCAVYVVLSCLRSIKASLQNRGITVSRDGVSVKTQRRFGRDAYLDATQRGFVKSLGAARVGPETHQHPLLPAPREKHLFGISMRRSHSGEPSEGQRQH